MAKKKSETGAEPVAFEAPPGAAEAAGFLFDLIRGLADTIGPNIEIEFVKHVKCCKAFGNRGALVTFKITVNDVSRRAQNNSGVKRVRLFGEIGKAKRVQLGGETDWKLSLAQEEETEDDDVSRLMKVCIPCQAITKKGRFTLRVEAVDDAGNKSSETLSVYLPPKSRACCGKKKP